MLTQISSIKKLLLASIAASALLLSACADKGAATTEEDPVADPQTEIEQEATGVNDVKQVTEDVNSADTSEDPLVVDPMVAEKTDATIVTTDELAAGEQGVVVDDSKIMDGTGKEEHVSTY